MPANPVHQLFLGVTLDGRYEVHAYRGEGHFSFVFEGRDAQRDQVVALKVLQPVYTATQVEEFETEEALLRLLAPASHIVKLLDSGTDRTSVMVMPPTTGPPIALPTRYLVLELADASLADLLADRDRLDWSDRLALFRDAVKGVHQMHARKVVHRDLKSDNLLVFHRGKTGAALRLSDLGRSRNLAEPPRFLSRDYELGRGDLRFAPPEFIWALGLDDNDHAFRRADLYLLGSVLFELATGQGLTALALGDPRGLMAHAVALPHAQRTPDFRGRLNELRARYQLPFDLVESELPAAIREQGMRLLRQLCDPDPSARDYMTRQSRTPRAWDLNWLIQRVDILGRQLAMSTLSTERQRRRRAK